MGEQRETAAYAARMRKLYKQITHADLTAAVNGDAQDILLGALPPGAVYLGYSFKITTFFTGGAASAVTMALGSGAAGDPDQLVTATNVFDTTTTAAWIKATAGVLVEPAPLPSTSIYAQFDVDAGHTLLALTAGSLEVEIYYAVADARQGSI